MAKFSAAQRVLINRKSRPKHLSPDEAGGELNIVPFLDIIMNVLMFILATLATIFTATIPVPAPSNNNRPGPTPPTERLNLTVKVSPTGYIVGAAGGFVAPGCTGLTPGGATVTVPNRPQADVNGYVHDFDGLTRCMVAIRQHWAEEVREDHSVNVSPNAEIPYGVLVRTIDAVRENRPGACRLPVDRVAGDYSNADCLFPEVTLGVLRN